MLGENEQGDAVMEQAPEKKPLRLRLTKSQKEYQQRAIEQYGLSAEFQPGVDLVGKLAGRIVYQKNMIEAFEEAPLWRLALVKIRRHLWKGGK